MCAGFVARECGLGLTIRVMVQVRDKVLLSKLATVLQQMDSSIFSSPEAVQEVSVILNAYAGSKMNDVALVLSQTLTNQVTLTHSLSPFVHCTSIAPQHTGAILTNSAQVLRLLT